MSLSKGARLTGISHQRNRKLDHTGDGNLRTQLLAKLPFLIEPVLRNAIAVAGFTQPGVDDGEVGFPALELPEVDGQRVGAAAM